MVDVRTARSDELRAVLRRVPETRGHSVTRLRGIFIGPTVQLNSVDNRGKTETQAGKYIFTIQRIVSRQ